MATTTPNFGWPVPTSTDLVKDGATAMEALGDAIDTSMVDLKGGTTGQVLSKATSADMDFIWTDANPGDITGVTAGTGISGGGTSGTVTVTNSMATAIDAKGDLVPGTGADTFARLAVGANGTVLTADSAEATGLKWATPAGGGGYTLLSTTTLSSSSTTISSISQDYKHLFIELNNITSASSGDQVYFRFNGDTGNNYHYGEFRMIGTTVTGNGNTDSFQQVLARVPNATPAKSGGAAIWLYRYTDTARIYGTSQAYGFVETLGGYTGQYVWNYDCSAAISSITIISGSAALAGTVYIYGVN